MPNNGFRKATRKQVKLRVALIGPSGAGKTYSALRLAAGMGGKVAMIDTEFRRGEYYADLFEYDVMTMDPPFSPERYVEVMQRAEAAGYDTLIVDSISHEWSGIGGILESKDKMPDANKFAVWGKLTPRHNAFVQAQVRLDLHLIVTMRGKDMYVIVEDDQGKSKPKKMGLGPDQRAGLEYEYTLVFLLDQDQHVATINKNNIGAAFENFADVLTEEHGGSLRKWSESGEKGGEATLYKEFVSQYQAAAKNPALAYNDARIADILAKAKQHSTDTDWLQRGLDWLDRQEAADDFVDDVPTETPPEQAGKRKLANWRCVCGYVNKGEDAHCHVCGKHYDDPPPETVDEMLAENSKATMAEKPDEPPAEDATAKFAERINESMITGKARPKPKPEPKDLPLRTTTMAQEQDEARRDADPPKRARKPKPEPDETDVAGKAETIDTLFKMEKEAEKREGEEPGVD